VRPQTVIVLPITVIVTLGIHDDRNLIESPFTAPGKGGSIDTRNIPLESPNQIRASLSIDFGPFGIARLSSWLMEGHITPLFVTLGFIRNIHIVHSIRKAVMRIQHLNRIVVFIGSIGGLGS
jgi:hypothetical protein